MALSVVQSPDNDGGFIAEDVGQWTEDKHALLNLYETLFSTGTKKKWKRRVYIDLYSGPGIVRLRGSGKLLWGSPLLAMQVKDPFDKYIFCESNSLALKALRKRVARLFPSADVSYIDGDSNEKVSEICAAIPIHSPSNKVLSFCFVDPYDLSIKFSTIRKLSDRFVDFLILLALGMDASRNLQHYLDTNNPKIDEFLGMSDWRSSWSEKEVTERITFPKFLAETYASQMQSLRYLHVPFHQMKQIRSDVKNLPLYHLALFLGTHLRKSIGGKF